MRKNTAPTKSKEVPHVHTPKKPSADAQLTENLKQAENHLIEAVKLFSGPRRVSRRAGYQDKLERLQEGVTTLYREELVRIRGPIKKRRK